MLPKVNASNAKCRDDVGIGLEEAFHDLDDLGHARHAADSMDLTSSPASLRHSSGPSSFARCQRHLLLLPGQVNAGVQNAGTTLKLARTTSQYDF